MRLWQVYNQRGGLSKFQTEMLFRDVLNETLVSAVHRQTKSDSSTLFEQISRYIHENYYLNHTTSSLAEQFGVNRNRISYVFTKHSGMGPATYLSQYRIKMAKRYCLRAKKRYIILHKLLVFMMHIISAECSRNLWAVLLPYIVKDSSIIHPDFSKFVHLK